MLHARLSATTGWLSNIWDRTPTFPDDVPLAQMPTGDAPWTYDAQNQLGVPVPPRQARTLHAIYTDLLALSGANKTAVWADLTSGSHPKIAAHTGPGAKEIFMLWRIGANASLPAATITDMRVTAAAYYVLDVPGYLVDPPFGTGINVPGDEPA